MVSFIQTVADIFAGYHTTTSYLLAPYKNRTINTCSIEIPLCGDTIEMPTFAMQAFQEKISDLRNVDAIVMKLHTQNRIPRYKTVSRYMKTILLNTRGNDDIFRLEIPIDNSAECKVYYGMHGAIFDEHLKPIVLCSWVLRKAKQTVFNVTVNKYYFIRPIVRINPSIYLSQKDAMEKFIVRNIMPGVLSARIRFAPGINSDYFDYSRLNSSGMPVKLEFDECPFKLVPITPPSIMTTNEMLIDTLKEHIDDFT
jgi:hypothetical protein